jgi:hypothetical protein
MSKSVKCPKCQSEQITGGKQGFGAGKAVIGAVVAGPIGIAAGAINKNKSINSCMACGHQWNPAAALHAMKVKKNAQKVQKNIGKPGYTLGYPNSEWMLAGVIGALFLIGFLVFG